MKITHETTREERIDLADEDTTYVGLYAYESVTENVVVWFDAKVDESTREKRYWTLTHSDAVKLMTQLVRCLHENHVDELKRRLCEEVNLRDCSQVYQMLDG